MEASLLRDHSPLMPTDWNAPVDPPVKRTKFENAEKSAVVGLKMLGTLVRLLGFNGIGQTLKSLEVGLNWIVVRQDLGSGRILSKLQANPATLSGTRDMVAGIRDLVQFAAIPYGMITVYTAQIRDYGQFDIFVYPFAKEVVNVFRNEARALLLLREVLELGVQLTAEKKDYAQIVSSTGTTVAVAASFLGFEQAGLVLGFVSQTFGIVVVLGRYVKQRLRNAPKKTHYDVQITQNAAQKLRHEFLTQSNQQLMRIHNCLRRNPELNTYEIETNEINPYEFNTNGMQEIIQAHFVDIERQMQEASNEHAVAAVLKNHYAYLKGLDQNILPTGMLADVAEMKARAKAHAAAALSSEQRAIEDLLDHEYYLQSQLSLLKSWQLSLKERKNFEPAQKQNSEIQKIIAKFETEFEEISRIQTEHIVNGKFSEDLCIKDREKIFATLTRWVSPSRYAYYDKKIARIVNLNVFR